MDSNNIFNFEKITLIIRLAKLAIEKTGSYRIVNKLTAAEIVELKKHFNAEYLYSIEDKHVYVLTLK